MAVSTYAKPLATQQPMQPSTRKTTVLAVATLSSNRHPPCQLAADSQLEGLLVHETVQAFHLGAVVCSPLLASQQQCCQAFAASKPESILSTAPRVVNSM